MRFEPKHWGGPDESLNDGVAEWLAPVIERNQAATKPFQSNTRVTVQVQNWRKQSKTGQARPSAGGPIVRDTRYQDA